MSADVWLEVDGEQVCLLPDDLDAEMRGMIPRRTAGGVDDTTANLTYNLSPMLWDAGFPGWKEVVNKPATEVAPIFAATHAALVAEPERARKLNPANGWGTYEDAVYVMGVLAVACKARPDATLRGWL